MKHGFGDKIKKFFLIVAALFSFYCINMDLNKTNIDLLLKSFTGEKTSLIKMVFLLKLSCGKIGENYVAMMFLSCAIIALFFYVSQKTYTKGEKAGCGILALFFSILQAIGFSFVARGNFTVLFGNKFLAVRALIYILGYSFFFCAVLLLIISSVKMLNQSEKMQPECSRKKNLFRFSLKLGVCWLPYYLIFWPGCMHGDVGLQLLQIFHCKTLFQGHWITDGVSVLYSNDHPFLHTMVLKLAVSIGQFFGNLNYGFAIYVFIQMALYIVLFSSLLVILQGFGVEKRYIRYAFWVYALCPIFPMFAILIGGDSFFSLLFVTYMIGMLLLFRTKGAILKNLKFDVLAICTLFLMSAAKNQGFYIVIFMIIPLLIIYRKYWKPLLSVLLISCFIYQFVYVGVLFPALKVRTVGKQEGMSILFQQTARYVKYHEKDVTNEEKESINAILAYDKLKIKYNEGLADPVKSSFKQDSDKKDMSRYLNTWFEMFQKQPLEYLNAFINMNYKYYYPFGDNGKSGRLYVRLQTIEEYFHKRSMYKKYNNYPEDVARELDFKSPKETKNARAIAISYFNIVLNNSLLGCFQHMGIVIWMILFAYLFFIMKKDIYAMGTFLPVLLIFGVCLLSPKNGNVRYLLPAIDLLPILLVMAFAGYGKIGQERKDKKNKTSKVQRGES